MDKDSGNDMIEKGLNIGTKHQLVAALKLCL